MRRSTLSPAVSISVKEAHQDAPAEERGDVVDHNQHGQCCRFSPPPAQGQQQDKSEYSVKPQQSRDREVLATYVPTQGDQQWKSEVYTNAQRCPPPDGVFLSIRKTGLWAVAADDCTPVDRVGEIGTPTCLLPTGFLSLEGGGAGVCREAAISSLPHHSAQQSLHR